MPDATIHMPGTTAVAATGITTNATPQLMSLNPAMIVFVLQQRLGDLDAQIATQVTAIEDNSKKASRLAEAVEHLQHMHSEAVARDADHDGTKKFEPSEIVVTVMVGNTPTEMNIDELADYYGMERIPVGEDNGKFTAESLGTFVDKVKGELRTLNSGNEMRMVQLQSLTQQRSQAISMSTQLLSAMNDSMKQIAGNIR